MQLEKVGSGIVVMRFGARDCHLLAQICQAAANCLDDATLASLQHQVETVGAMFQAAAQAVLAQQCLDPNGQQAMAADLADVAATTTLHQ